MTGGIGKFGVQAGNAGGSKVGGRFAEILSGVQVGRKFSLDESGAPVSLGRFPENTICFSGPDGTLVSGRHAVVEKRGEELWVRDLGSTNGTFVNGRRIGQHLLRPGEVVSLGKKGPALRIRAPLPGIGVPPPRVPAANSSPGGKAIPAGSYTVGLAQRLKDDEAGTHEMRDLLKTPGRARRLFRLGALSGREAGMIGAAAASHASHRKKGLWIIASVSFLALSAVGGLLLQNSAHRDKLRQQEILLANVRRLEAELAEAKRQDPVESSEDRQLLAAKLRAAERRLVGVGSDLKTGDIINTYRHPLGREIQSILEGFGKRDYIVPDLFIRQVEKHIGTFNRPPARAMIARSLANSVRYRRLIEAELDRQGMPRAFFYLAMHESALDSAIVSRSGARGLWQFMPQTAREYGLRVPVNWRDLPPEQDPRTRPAPATRAGVKYVKTLYAEFGDVALAMAAYNAGEGRIRKALRSIDDPVNNRDFWYIYRLGVLADETNEYVPKIIATMIIDRNRARYGFTP